MSLILNGTDGITFPDSTEMSSAEQAASAWIKFDGTGTVAITDSFNISSITDNGVGAYHVTFATAMANANYAMVGSVGGSAASGMWITSGTSYGPYNNADSTTLSRLQIFYATTSQTDEEVVAAAFFGGK